MGLLNLRFLKALLFTSGTACFGLISQAATLPTLTVYTYDSFAAPEGLGPAVIPAFEKKCGCRVKLLPAGDGGQVLNRVELDAKRGKQIADVMLGIDQYLWPRAREYSDTWGNWRPAGIEKLIASTVVESGFLPFDYGVLTMMGDFQELKKKKLEPPTSLYDLLKPEWRRNFLLEDPRTSTPGLAFLVYTEQALPGQFSDFWRKLRGQWLTMPPGWDQAYGLFLKGEAPLVWSYSTSQAYHEEKKEQASRYRAIFFREGQPIQIEGAAIVKGLSDARRKIAREFLEFLLSLEVQNKIPTRNWMFPATKSASLPASFKALKNPEKIYNHALPEAQLKATIADWARNLGETP